MSQLNNPYIFTATDSVTATKLNNMITLTTVGPEIISLQNEKTTPVSTDVLLGLDGITSQLIKVKAGNLSLAGVTTSAIIGPANSDINITPQDGTIVTGSSFNSVNGLTTLVTTTSSHGLSVGQVITTSASTKSGYNGKWRITAVTTVSPFTFTYEMPMVYGTGTFSYTSGTLVTVTSASAHGFVDGQSIIITASNSTFSGTYGILTTGVNTFTYNISASTTATTGTINYTTTSAKPDSGIISYTKEGVFRNLENEVINGNFYVDGNTFYNGSVTNGGSVTNNGSVLNTGTLVTNGTVTMNGPVTITGNLTIPTSAAPSGAVNNTYFNSYSSNYGVKFGNCFATDSSTLYKTTNEFTIPTDETWIFEFHTHWMYSQGGNTRPDNYFYLSATLEKTGTADVVLFTETNCSTAYGAQARAFVAVILNSTLMASTSKKLKFTTTNTNVDTGRSGYMISVRKMKTVNFDANVALLA